jgi:tripartite-type tricarboxylate transporter receptor subunit TctC
VARALPDGDTLWMGGLAELAISPSVRNDLHYDPVKDFAPISLIFKVPYVLVIHPSITAKTFQEFVAYAKANGKNMSFASYGNYSSNHLLGELLKQTAGFESTHVPYKGSGSLATDLLAGRVQWTLDTPVAAQQHLKSGALRGLAIATEQRLPIIPDVPTFAEAGQPGFIGGTWIGLLAPANTSPSYISRVQLKLNEVLNSPELVKYFEQSGIQGAPTSSRDFALLIQEDLVKWRKVASKAGLI